MLPLRRSHKYLNVPQNANLLKYSAFPLPFFALLIGPPSFPASRGEIQKILFAAVFRKREILVGAHTHTHFRIESVDSPCATQGFGITPTLPALILSKGCVKPVSRVCDSQNLSTEIKIEIAFVVH